MNHSPALPPHAAAAHDKGYLQRLLSERNQLPASGTGVIDAAIEKAFVRSVAILVLDMCGFSRITQRHGIIHFLAMIHQMEQAARPAIEGNGGEVIKQEADNLFAVFATPEQALEAALDTLRTLSAMNTVLPPRAGVERERRHWLWLHPGDCARRPVWPRNELRLQTGRRHCHGQRDPAHRGGLGQPAHRALCVLTPRPPDIWEGVARLPL